jgi:hypothetical protein
MQLFDPTIAGSAAPVNRESQETVLGIAVTATSPRRRTDAGTVRVRHDCPSLFAPSVSEGFSMLRRGDFEVRVGALDAATNTVPGCPTRCSARSDELYCGAPSPVRSAPDPCRSLHGRRLRRPRHRRARDPHLRDGGSQRAGRAFLSRLLAPHGKSSRRRRSGGYFDAGDGMSCDGRQPGAGTLDPAPRGVIKRRQSATVSNGLSPCRRRPRSRER